MYMKSGMLLAGFACLALLTGCAEEGPPRFDISGEVTYGGKPIPRGMIQFVPDASQGNSGPSGQAEIVDGKFNTAEAGIGVVGGPHRVTIEAFDGNAKPELELPNGQPLFYGYQEQMDLPREDSLTRNIDVPPQREVRQNRRSLGEPHSDEV